MNNKKFAFSLVEIIIVITIMVLLSVIGLSSKQGYDENMNNTKVLSDIETINNALESYIQENKSLPMPGGNTNFFKIDTSYAHSYEDNETFGVYGSITEDIIPKKYLNIFPLDPRTSNYYSYGKTKGSAEIVANQFEIAGVQVKEGTAKAKVSGNYTAEAGPYNLIRSYNSANFVTDKSTTNLPYNPDEFILIATDNNGVVYREGNTITATDSDLELFFADGSVSILTQGSTITLNTLNFPNKNNLNTTVKLALSAGTIWTKATHLNDESKFEVYTTDSVAAVRGTIFGVTKDTDTTITLIEGALTIYKSPQTDTNIIINPNTELKIQDYETPYKQEIQVQKDETPQQLEIQQTDYETQIPNIQLNEIQENEDTQNDIIEVLESFTKAESVRDEETEISVQESAEAVLALETQNDENIETEGTTEDDENTETEGTTDDIIVIEDLSTGDILTETLEGEFTIDMELDNLPSLTGTDVKYLIYKDNFRLYVNADGQLCFQESSDVTAVCQQIGMKENGKFEAKISRGSDNKVWLNDYEKDITLEGEFDNLQIGKYAEYDNSGIIPSRFQFRK